MTRFRNCGAFTAFALVFPIAVDAASVTVGGQIHARVDIHCSVDPGLDFSTAATDARIAQCRVSSNTPTFEVRLVTGLRNGYPDGDAFKPESLELMPLGGRPGEGLQLPASPELLQGWRDGEWVWEAGPQTSASVDFLFELRGSWAGRAREWSPENRPHPRGRPWVQVITASL